jgi:hypothetical protein
MFMLKNTTANIILLVSLALGFFAVPPRPSNAQGAAVAAAVEIIQKIYETYKTIKELFEPSEKDLLQRAVHQVIQEMRSLHDEDLIDGVNGLNNTFQRIAEMRNETDIGLFLRDSDDIKPKLERIINEKDRFRAYEVASAYNLLIALRFGLMRDIGYSRELINSNLLDAVYANDILLGSRNCTFEYNDTGGINIRSIYYYPRTGKIYQYYTPRYHRGFYDDPIYQLVLQSNEQILHQVPDQCSAQSTGILMPKSSIMFKWIFAGTPKIHSCLSGSGIACYWFPEAYEGLGDPPLAGLQFYCTQVAEPSEPPDAFWFDNWLCSDTDLGMIWSYRGPIANMNCLQWNEPSDPHRWNDNFLCFNQQAVDNYIFRWSYRGPINDMNCTQIIEPSAPREYTWRDNYFCYIPR